MRERPARDGQCIVFAGGGSGGHLSPSLAIAERIHEQAPEMRCVFFCSTRSIDATILSEAGVVFEPIEVFPPSMRPRAALRFLRTWRRSVRRSRMLLQQYGATQVVAMGGFVAAAVVAGAKNLPVTLMNLDDPPGKANRCIARRAERALSAIELPSHHGFAERVVGMPIRRRALAPLPGAGAGAPPELEAAEHCRAALGLDPQLPTLLVTGASQGASSINALMEYLAKNASDLFRGWQVLHLTGEGSGVVLADAYKRSKIPAVVMPFLHEMGLAWGAAACAISRSGASSVAEAIANGVPTLFLPYPYHPDMHQTRNAQPWIDRGAALMTTDLIEPQANAAVVAPMLRRLMADQAQRDQIRQAIQRHQPEDAASTIAKLLLTPTAPRNGPVSGTPGTCGTSLPCMTHRAD